MGRGLDLVHEVVDFPQDGVGTRVVGGQLPAGALLHSGGEEPDLSTSLELWRLHVVALSLPHDRRPQLLPDVSVDLFDAAAVLMQVGVEALGHVRHMGRGSEHHG